MRVVVPDEFRAELESKADEDLTVLRQASYELATSGLDHSEMKGRFVAKGWSNEFSDWYAARLQLSGPNIELGTGLEPKITDQMAEYNALVAAKRRQWRTGWMMVISAIVVSAAFQAWVAADPDPKMVVLLWCIDFPVTTILWFGGLASLAKSKGRSPWTAAMGFVPILAIAFFFLEDRNIIRMPSKTSDFVKPDGAVFSDW